MSGMFPKLNPKIGIDLGTTNVLVFVPGEGIVLNEPSVVAISDDNQVLAVGMEAKPWAGLGAVAPNENLVRRVGKMAP